jgi:hypothetical protein
MRRTVGLAAAATLAAACWALPGVAFADDGADPAPQVTVVEVGDPGDGTDPGADGEPVYYSLPVECEPADDTTADRVPCPTYRDVTCPDDTTADDCPVYAPTNGGGVDPLPVDNKSGGGPESMSGTPEETADTGGDGSGSGGSGSGGSGSGGSGGSNVPDDSGAADDGAVIAPASSDDPEADSAGNKAAAGGTSSTSSTKPAPAAGVAAAQTPAAPANSGAPVALVLGTGALAAAGIAGAAIAVRRRRLSSAR